MKRSLLLALSITFCLCALLALSSCAGTNGGNNKNDHTHTPGEAVRENLIPSTCNSYGSYNECTYCSECGELMVRALKDIQPHSDCEWIDEIPATCYDDGVLGHFHCSVCEGNFVYEERPGYILVGGDYTDRYLTGVDSLTIEAIGHKDKIIGDSLACALCGDPVAESEGIIYSLSADGSYAEVIDYVGENVRIRIPDTYNGAPVTVIASSAFENKAIKSVVIPDSVTVIGVEAFRGCSNLSSIFFGNGVETILNNAFFGCGSLTSVIISDSVISIETGAFQNCKKLSDLILGSSVRSIAAYAFNGCALKSVTIPESVTSLSRVAFYSGESMFSDIMLLGTILPIEKENGVTYVDKWVVGFDNSVTSVSFREGAVGIATGAFISSPVYSLSKLRSVTLPDSVKHVDAAAFSGCSNLEIIYCEAESQPDSWNPDWNAKSEYASENRIYFEVVWSFKASE